MTGKKVEDYILTIPDYPKPGIMFRDITTVLDDPEGFRLCVDELNRMLEDADFDVVAGIETRGVLFGSILAYLNGKSFAFIRKKGKLPRETVEESYELEYGQGAIELHVDSLKKGQKVVVVDDLLATGGTALAACHLCEKLGAKVSKIIFVSELLGLNGRAKLKDYDVGAIVSYEGN